MFKCFYVKLFIFFLHLWCICISSLYRRYYVMWMSWVFFSGRDETFIRGWVNLYLLMLQRYVCYTLCRSNVFYLWGFNWLKIIFCDFAWATFCSVWAQSVRVERCFIAQLQYLFQTVLSHNFLQCAHIIFYLVKCYSCSWFFMQFIF